MEKYEIIQLVLVKLSAETSDENVLVFKTLLGGPSKKRDLSNTFKEKGYTPFKIHSIFDSLNKKDIIKWEVVKGIAMVMLTKTAKKAFILEYTSVAGEEYGERLQDFLESTEESIEEFLSRISEKGRSFSEKMRRKTSQVLRKMASGLDDKKK